MARVRPVYMAVLLIALVLVLVAGPYWHTEEKRTEVVSTSWSLTRERVENLLSAVWMSDTDSGVRYRSEVETYCGLYRGVVYRIEDVTVLDSAWLGIWKVNYAGLFLLPIISLLAKDAKRGAPS